MSLEKDNGLNNIDSADFHGLTSLGNGNPYVPPNFEEDLTSERGYVKLGIWSYLSIAVLILWYALWSYINISVGLEIPSGIQGSVLFITMSLLFVHLLVLFKVEAARKLAVAHAFILLIGFPVGTVIGLILLKSLKGKVFRKSGI